MMLSTFYIKNQILHINIMFAKITKSKIEGKKMIVMFYDNEKKPVKTDNFGAAGYPDYTISPHGEKPKKIYIKRHKEK